MDARIAGGVGAADLLGSVSGLNDDFKIGKGLIHQGIKRFR
jgi:hypothetical protein